MGLDFSHGKAHWSYSGFHRARCRLALEIGINFEKMRGIAPYDEALPWEPHIKTGERIIPLLIHSDCDGYFMPSQCRKIAPRLRELVSKWPDGDGDKIQFLLLADGMDQAAQERKRFKFM